MSRVPAWLRTLPRAGAAVSAFVLALVLACGGPGDASSASNASPLDVVPFGSGDFTRASSWTSHDLSDVLGTSRGGFCGSAFDGRYLYLAPCYGQAFVRFDTQAPFASAASYVAMNGSAVAGFGSFAGAVFDGRTVYYVPAFTGVIVRYDTSAPFESPSSYAHFDLATTGAPPTTAFSGGTFDGRYVYFAPQGVNAFSGYAVRFDAQADFSLASSYQAFDLTSLDATAAGFEGAAFDGRYVYFAPFAYAGLARFDTTAPFDAGGFTLLGAAPSAGAAFDGQFVSFAPGGVVGKVLLYDTRGSVDSGAVFAAFDPSRIVGKLQAYHGVLYDGRYVYFGSVASAGTTSDPGSVVLRRDTHGAFTDPASWSKFDVGTLTPAAGNFYNMAFDGRYVYFVPWQSTVLARFDTGRAATPPSTAHGSFY
jgi:hypothetical protein